MNENRVKQIIECENRLLKDRMFLNELAEECEAGDGSEIIRLKIENLQREMDYMNLQLAMILQEYNYNRNTESRYITPNQEHITAYNPVPGQGNRAGSTGIPDRQFAAGYRSTPDRQKTYAAPAFSAYPQTPQHVIYQQQPKQKQDMEKTIGKSVMGICASVLIFIGLILFATIIIPYLTQTLKMSLMYAFSLCFAITGILLVRKERDNKLYLSIAGCGLGAVYISLFVSRIYFRALNDIALYLLVFVWAAAVCALSRLRSDVFLSIGQSGIAISILFGVVLCGAARDENKLLFLLIYVLITEAVFYISHLHRDYHKNLLNHIFMTICFVLLLPGVNAGYMRKSAPGSAAGLLLMAAACIPIILSLTYFSVDGKKNISFGVLNTLFFAAAWFAFCGQFGHLAIVMSVLAALLLAGIEMRFSKKGDILAGKIIFQVTLFLSMLCGLLETGWAKEYISVAVFAVGCVVYGFCRRDGTYKIAGLAYGVLYLLIPMNIWLHAALGIGIFAVSAVLLYRFKEQYHTWIKLTAYPLFLFFLAEDIGRIFVKLHVGSIELRVLVGLGILGAVNLMMMKIFVFRKNPGTGAEEKEVLTETGIINLLWMVVSLFCIREMEPLCYRIPAILLGLALFMINSGNLLKKYDGGWPGIYVGTKFLVLVLTIINSFSSPDFFISIAGLVFAAVFITSGFFMERRTGKNFRPIRIYGLVLALLGIIKLILIDIHYDSVLLRSAGFFVSGVLCFVISLIYHLADKKAGRKESL